MDKKILFIDGQVFQSEAWDRGMGKYSLALLKSIAIQVHSFDKVHIIFTKNLPLEENARTFIKKAMPDAHHIFADLKTPFDPSLADIPTVQEQNRKVVNRLISQHRQSSTDNITYLVLALFIDSVCSVFPSLGQRVLLFYDLIPLQYSERYGQLPNYRNYLTRFKVIFEADIILTISQTVADDVALNLGISPTKIFNVDGAAIERSVQTAQKPSVELPERYILMPSGNELRKNNIRAVQGFEAYLQKSGDNELKLIITSTFDDVSRQVLRAHSENIIFTGNVTEQELRWLYEHAEALLFVPEYEGLGLPILEAVEIGKPVVCSNLTVFNEMSTSAFYYSDPHDSSSIADALEEALDDTEFAEKLKEYPKILKKYTWANTADKALSAISSAKTKPRVAKKMRIAILAPTPGGYSAIGKLIMLMHPAMSEYFDIDYYLEDGKSGREFTRPNYLPYVSNVFPAEKFNRKKYKQYEAVVYHIGNSEFHLETIKSALYLPGYAIVHDTHLANVFETDLLSYGYVTQNRLDAEKALDKLINNSKASYLSSIANNHLALIAHSSFSRDGLNKSSLDTSPKTFQLNIPTAIPQQAMVKNSSRQITIGLAGIIHPLKGLDAVENIAKLPDFLDCKILIFGIPLISDSDIERLRAYPNVQVETNLTDFQFQNLLSQLDILISFRPDNRGYPSLATIEAMRFGVIPIVKKLGWYDELPDSAVVKVKTEKELVNELQRLIDDPKRRAKIQKEARKFIGESHNYELYAETLYNLISSHDKTAKTDEISAAIKSGASLRKVKKLIGEK